MTDRIRGRARAERNARILRRDPVCYICGLSIDLTIPWPQPMCGVVDHVIAINRGGKDDATNLRSAHNKCNRDKSDKDFAPNIFKRSGTLARPAAQPTQRAARRPTIAAVYEDDDDDDFDPSSVSF
jgi:5-methylcytosine-specific restriction endonuclease McrA